jgi:putative ABC transport system substrate-binding protein
MMARASFCLTFDDSFLPPVHHGTNVAVIVASGSELPLQAAVAASSSIPIVMLANNYDPIARGYVTSLARPGGRITGLFYRQPELAQKRVELLTEAFPTRTRLAVLWDASSSEPFGAAGQTAGENVAH